MHIDGAHGLFQDRPTGIYGNPQRDIAENGLMTDGGLDGIPGDKGQQQGHQFGTPFVSQSLKKR
jgi:hypothetical protein